MQQSIHCLIYGTVQGVSFRYYTQQQAEKLQLRGWVRNRADGSVKAYASGHSESIQAMREFLQQGSPLAKVERIESLPLPNENQSQEEGFLILPTV